MGEGHKIRLLEDRWIGETPLAQRFPMLYKKSNTHKKSFILLDQQGILFRLEVICGI